MATKKKALKKSKLRHAEYYDFQKIQDKLYAESMDGKMFTKLVEIITLPENIKLAYPAMGRTLRLFLRLCLMGTLLSLQSARQFRG